jgi:hypothetical protein
MGAEAIAPMRGDQSETTGPTRASTAAWQVQELSGHCARRAADANHSRAHSGTERNPALQEWQPVPSPSASSW